MSAPVGRRIRFIADFNYSPTPAVTIAYKAGMIEFVRLECAQRAIAKGNAIAVDVGAPPAGLEQTLRRKRRRTRAKSQKSERTQDDASGGP